MNKEEALNKIIEYYKNGSKTPVSDFCRIPCSVCPFVGDYCEQDIADILIERLVKAKEQSKSLEKTCYKLQQTLEEKKETNLEHYIVRNGVHITKEHDVEVWEFRFKKGTEKQFFDANIKSVLDWLLLPYEPPKYKLSKFEFDLLDYCCYKQQDDTLKDWTVLKDMHDKGHYKGIPEETKIRDILDNCEVAD